MTPRAKQVEENYQEAEIDKMEREVRNDQGMERSRSRSSEEASPRGVLDRAISSDLSTSSSGSGSSCSVDKLTGNPDETSNSNSNSNSSSSNGNGNGNGNDNGIGIGSQWKGFLNTMKKKSGVGKISSSTASLWSGYYDLSAKSLCKKLGRIRSGDNDSRMFPMSSKPSWRNFGYSELAAATDHFSSERLLGKGGHAEVYKGCLPDGSIVAVKRLTKKGEKQDEERTADFLSELGIIAHVDHPNAAKLVGFGIEAGLYLILQFAPNCSLESCLQDSSEVMDWQTRFRVALGVAEGLSYLHHTCQRRIIHRDIKASNILLGEDYEPLVSDFGLAKWLPENWLNHVIQPIEGTFGYLAPESVIHGIADEKTDVFAYGVLLLEIITGRQAVALDDSRQSLVIWAKPFLEAMDVKALVDPKLEGEYDTVEMERIMTIASMCLHPTPTHRPYMNKVVELLKEEGGDFDLMKQDSATSRSLLLEACDLEDYSCTNYLEDLNRHMELVME